MIKLNQLNILMIVNNGCIITVNNFQYEAKLLKFIYQFREEVLQVKEFLRKHEK